jgi:protein-tyrosine phosphatase
MTIDQILRNLFVGSYPRDADDIDTLKQSGVSAVLNLQSDEDLKYLDVDWCDLTAQYFAKGIKFRRVPIIDFNDDDLRDRLPEAVRTLGELMDEGHTVYTHCNAGVNRSPSTVITYLYWVEKWSLDEAERHVRNAHPCMPVMDVIKLATRDRLNDDLSQA